MRLSVFSPESSPQLFIDLQKLYHGYLSEQQLTPDALQKLISTPEKLFFVTLFNARHLGAVQVSIEQSKAQLSLLCVRDITRRRGVGKNLLREVENKLKAKGVDIVLLSTAKIANQEVEGMKQFMLNCGYQLENEVFSKML